METNKMGTDKAFYRTFMVNFWFDGIDELDDNEISEALETVLDSGAESTNSDLTVILQSKSEDVVIISKEEYESLLDDQEMLSCLQAVGVDNWHGYSEAIQMMEEEEE